MTLQQQNSLEQWAAWLDGVVSQVLKPHQHSPTFQKAAKLFLLKWSFYRCGTVERTRARIEFATWPKVLSSVLQFHGDSGPYPAERSQFWLLSPDSPSV